MSTTQSRRPILGSAATPPSPTPVAAEGPDALSGYELLANLGLAALGLIVLTAASWGEPSS